jgi:hypothetical protein
MLANPAGGGKFHPHSADDGVVLRIHDTRF